MDTHLELVLCAPELAVLAALEATLSASAAALLTQVEALQHSLRRLPHPRRHSGGVGACRASLRALPQLNLTPTSPR